MEKNPVPMQETEETQFRALGREDSPGGEFHFSILAWRRPCTEEPGGYSPRGCEELDTAVVTEHTQLFYSVVLASSVQ